VEGILKEVSNILYQLNYLVQSGKYTLNPTEKSILKIVSKNKVPSN